MRPPDLPFDLEHDSCGVGMVADLTGEPRHATLSDALTILENLEHRGAVGADPDSGDGAGVMIQLPHALLRERFTSLPEPGGYGVAQWMVPRGRSLDEFDAAIDEACARVGLSAGEAVALGTDSSLLGPGAASGEPHFVQQVLVPRLVQAGEALEAALFCARRLIERSTPLYAASMSSRTAVYKGMLTAPQLRRYFADLRDERTATAVAVVHSRFSTNVLPRWELAQPFRVIAHNGEINTVRGNRNWMGARESTLASDALPVGVAELVPIVTPGLSDSGSFDEVLELLTRGGRTLAHAVLMMIPEAWERHAAMDPARRDFYRYHAALMEPWDGPASVTFCDGLVVGAVLDRNGLRPARYWVTDDQRVVLASEVGVLPVDPARVVRKGRLQPGRVFLVDLVAGRVVDDDELKSGLARRAPYGAWLEAQVSLDDLPERPMLTPNRASVRRQQVARGYGTEDLRLILAPMARTGEEPVGSMGSDTAIAALSTRPRSAFDYFSQLFAQVTNPPLDAIREELVTSTRVALGGEGNLLAESPGHCRQVVLASPVLSAEDLAKLRYVEEYPSLRGFVTEVVDALFTPGEDPAASLAAALEDLGDRVSGAVRAGATLVVLSDRDADGERAPIPSLLATSAVHHRLVAEHLRTQAALILEAGDAREVHHVALLVGFGASAVCPWLAYETVDELVRDGDVEGPERDARARYAKALTRGLVKVMSKMGVSTVAGYLAAQLFEAVAVSGDVLRAYFPGMRSPVGGATLARLAGDAAAWHAQAAGAGDDPLGDAGEYQWRRDGEVHLFNPRTVHKLQHATRSKRFDVFREYSALVDDRARRRATLRSFLELVPATTPTPLDEVEPAAAIIRRFSTGAMSYGSISAEAHETLAVAMNRLGGRSNTGEGGEDEDRFDDADPSRSRRSAVKQVASGRFGVTSRYLVSADDLQIKIAQGAKPGEGGQLPGAKVTAGIAATRHSIPGVGLISPPPHHDIYSIEDLAQLVYDLKCANDAARVHVKLVSEQGVGTVAAGVTKAHADVILISGHDGGTGAAPLTSIKHAGTPWELGLADAHQTLAANGLRSRVVLQVDGQLKTGRDVILAALLGAEEFGFASAPLVVSGCVMMRVCHLDTCPVGIATQNPQLRERFTGRPEFVETFFEFLAEEVREHLSLLGARTLDEVIGDVARLRARAPEDPRLDLDLSALLTPVDPDQRRQSAKQDHGLDGALDWSFLDDAVGASARGESLTVAATVRNCQRAVGTLTGSALTRAHGRRALPTDALTLELTGSAGQSLGAFVPAGVTIRLEGDANDYVAKGLSGGRVVISPPRAARYASEDNVIAGNVLAYGATSGEVFARGVVGERCGVRNSGATIVVEGAGDHLGEYMTGGVIAVLGRVGRNLAAGMSGGTLYLFDPEGRVHDHLAAGVYEIDPLDAGHDERLRDLLERFGAETGSRVAAALLGDWRRARMGFVTIEATEYQRARDEHRG